MIDDFEAHILKKYGKRKLLHQEAKKIIDEAIENSFITSDDVDNYNNCTTAEELLTKIKNWKTAIFDDNYSPSDMYLNSRILNGQENTTVNNLKDSFLTTNETLTELKDKTRVITQRGTQKSKAVIEDVLKALKEYEEIEIKKTKKTWYWLLVLLIIPLCFVIYVPKPY